MASTSRMLFGMSKNKQMPRFLGKLNHKYGVPRNAVITNTVIAAILLLVFESWTSIMQVLSLVIIISYTACPVALVTLRKNVSLPRNRFILPFSTLVSLIGFIFCSLILYWTNTSILTEVVILMLIGIIGYGIFLYREGKNKLKIAIKPTLWFISYLIIMSIISYIGGKEFGGDGLIDNLWSHILVIIFSIFCFFWGTNSYFNKKNTSFITITKKND